MDTVGQWHADMRMVHSHLFNINNGTRIAAPLLPIAVSHPFTDEKTLIIKTDKHASNASVFETVNEITYNPDATLEEWVQFCESIGDAIICGGMIRDDIAKTTQNGIFTVDTLFGKITCGSTATSLTADLMRRLDAIQ
jgi:hypothetical protein